MLINSKLLLVSFCILTLLNFKIASSEQNVSTLSSLIKDPNLIFTSEDLVLSEYNITESVPRLFKTLFPLSLEVNEKIGDLAEFKYSNTSRALGCYEKLPLYTIIRGLLKEYSYFLLVYYRLRCENYHYYHDGSTCGDILYLIDLMENKSDILKERLTKKKNECFSLEFNIVSVQSRYYDSLGFIGREGDNVDEEEYLRIERSFLRRTILEYESKLIEKTISYERYCMSNSEYDGDLDCYLLRLECWLLESELTSLSEEHFKRVSRFKRLKDIAD